VFLVLKISLFSTVVLDLDSEIADFMLRMSMEEALTKALFRIAHLEEQLVYFLVLF
jgi:hypothetical protein